MAFDRSSWPTQSGGRRDAIAAEIDAEAASFWQAAVTRLAREINLGWWLAGWLPWAVAVGLVGTFAMLYPRLRGGHPGLVWTGIVLALAAGAIVAWRRSRDRFETAASARVRLEEALGLKARLTAASAGVHAIRPSCRSRAPRSSPAAASPNVVSRAMTALPRSPRASFSSVAESGPCGSSDATRRWRRSM